MAVTGKGVHINVPLSQVAINFRPYGMIADQLSPIVVVPKQSDAYYVWSKADAYRIDETYRAPGTDPNKVVFNVTSATFFCDNYALSNPLPYEDIENADAGFIMAERSNRVQFVVDKLYLDWEKRVADMVSSTSNVGSYSAVASNWSDETDGNSDPIGDINTAIQNVAGAGYRANSIHFDEVAWNHYRNHGSVIDRLYGNTSSPRGRVVTTDNVKTLHEVERVTVGRALYNTAQEGQTASLSRIWGSANVLVYYAPMTPRKDVPSFMYSFRWNRIMTMQAEIHDDKKAKCEEIVVGYYQDEKITASELGFIISDVASSV
jgi:hypothetical protein